MRIAPLALSAVLGALLFAAATSARADDPDAKAGGVIVVGDSVTKFRVTHDRTAGTITFRQVDPAVQLSDGSVVVLKTATGPTEVALMPVEGQPRTWVVRHDALRAATYDGSLRVAVAGKVYTSPLVVAAAPSGPAVKVAPRHGGTILAFPQCAANVEIVRDAATGTLTIYSFEDVQILEAPVITVRESTGPATTKVTAVDGQPGVWRVTSEQFKTTTMSGRIKILVNGKPCETDLSFAPHGGRVVSVAGGPSFEVVQMQDTAGGYRFYALDETIEGKAYTIENPQFVMTTAEGPKTVVLQPVEGEPRAWQLIGLEAHAHRPFDGELRFTLFGKSLGTRVGVSGVGVDVR
jgi:hypothetical protein